MKKLTSKSSKLFSSLKDQANQARSSPSNPFTPSTPPSSKSDVPDPLNDPNAPPPPLPRRSPSASVRAVPPVPPLPAPPSPSISNRAVPPIPTRTDSNGDLTVPSIADTSGVPLAQISTTSLSKGNTDEGQSPLLPPRMGHLREGTASTISLSSNSSAGFMEDSEIEDEQERGTGFKAPSSDSLVEGPPPPPYDSNLNTITSSNPSTISSSTSSPSIVAPPIHPFSRMNTSSSTSIMTRSSTSSLFSKYTAKVIPNKASSSALGVLSLTALTPLVPHVNGSRNVSDGLPSPGARKEYIMHSLKTLGTEKSLLFGPPVSVYLVNETGCEIKWGKWPVRERKVTGRGGRKRVVKGWRGEYWVDQNLDLNKPPKRQESTKDEKESVLEILKGWGKREEGGDGGGGTGQESMFDRMKGWGKKEEGAEEAGEGGKESMLHRMRGLVKEATVKLGREEEGVDGKEAKGENEKGKEEEAVKPEEIKSTSEMIEIAKMRGMSAVGDNVGGLLGTKKVGIHYGWLYLDLVQPSGRLLHIQIYLCLRRPTPENKSPIHIARIGRFDLDSTVDNPLSSGTFDKAHVEMRGVEGSDELNVVFVLEKGLEDDKNAVNDDTIRKSKLIPAKGVRISSWCSHKKGTISVSAAKEARYHEYDLWTSPRNPNLGVIVHSKHVLTGFLDGKHIWVHVQHEGEEVLADYVKVNPLTGQASTKGRLASTLETPAMIVPKLDMSINYGFSDAGVKKSNQVYVYVTHYLGNWLAQLIKEDPSWLQVPFSTLALAGSHDCGMFTKLDRGLYTFMKHGSLSKAAAKQAAAKQASFEEDNKMDDLLPLVHFLVSGLKLFNIEPDRAIQNVANTQKDSIKTQLELGVRFFDMRPGWCFYDCYESQKTVLYHQHSIVPGVQYVQFLVDIFNFLGENEQEIVVVELKSDNIIRRGNLIPISMVPTEEELQVAMDEARSSVSEKGRAIRLATKEDLSKEIGELINENKRLFLFDRVHEENPWKRADSYDGRAYNTFKPEPIMERLRQTHLAYSKTKEGDDRCEGPRGTIYQLQATPTADIGADIAASLTYSDASSLLVYMKAVMDRETYDWIANNDFNEPGNPIFLNDFVDGALVEHCIEVSKQRSKNLKEGVKEVEEEGRRNLKDIKVDEIGKIEIEGFDEDSENKTEEGDQVTEEDEEEEEGGMEGDGGGGKVEKLIEREEIDVVKVKEGKEEGEVVEVVEVVKDVRVKEVEVVELDGGSEDGSGTESESESEKKVGKSEKGKVRDDGDEKKKNVEGEI